MKYYQLLLLSFLIFLSSCIVETQETPEIPGKSLTIFFVNDVHAQIDNFAKVKHIVDAEREITNVAVVSSGDLFSGNPVVDNHTQKGFPIIDLMNKVGFDVAVLGNHEFDYGLEVLKNRISQSDFQWVCANVFSNTNDFPQPAPYATINVNDIKVTFLGLIETWGSNTTIIPSTHPWRVKDLNFQAARDVSQNFANLKNAENADLFVALSHLGHSGNETNIGDFQLASQSPFFDIIIGGHSHAKLDTVIANTPIYQSGGYLNYLGKIELTIDERSLTTSKFTLIDLNNYPQYDSELQNDIDDYNNLPELKEVIGNSTQDLSRSEVGCFYTDALRETMNVDITFQNTGGVRSGLDKGEITKREIYEISPFNNGTVIYNMTVAEIKEFLIGSESGFYYSGIILQKVGENIEIRDLLSRKLPNDYVLKVGINDYIPAVHSTYFPNNGEVQELTAAETLIYYLESINSEIDYNNCNRYFRY